ncbi:MAG: hypothetical protein KDB90_13385 [Planctomycetes bacterium]|nr:hypothetical protein [Planctomycetota bacterium]
MKIGCLGECETRIALRVLDFVAFGPLARHEREFRKTSGLSLEDFRKAAWNRLDEDPQLLEQAALAALSFAVGEFQHRLWNQLEKSAHTPIRQLARIRDKLQSCKRDRPADW